MSAKKRQKRVREAGDEYAEHVIAEAENKLIASKSNDELFFVDTVGSKTSRRRIAKETAVSILPGKGVKSKTDETLIKKLLPKKHITNKAEQLAVVVRPSSASSGCVDLWGDETIVTVNTKRTSGDVVVRNAIKTNVPVPGQSYNPSKAEHQKAIRVATEVEQTKLAKDERDKGKMNMELSEFTAQFIKNSEEDDEEEEEVDVVDGAPSSVRTRKLKQKLTKAERNKIRNRHDAEFLIHRQQNAKRLEKQLNSVQSIVKEMKKGDAAEARQIDAVKQQKKAADDLKAHKIKNHEVMSYVEAGAVPLSDELHGSMRNIQIKQGLLLQAEVEKLTDAGEVMVFQRRARRGGEKNPFAGKNIKWIPKYKYV